MHMCMHTRTSMLNDPLPPRPMTHCLGHVIISNLVCFYNNMTIQQFNVIKSILLSIGRLGCLNNIMFTFLNGLFLMF